MAVIPCNHCFKGNGHCGPISVNKPNKHLHALDIVTNCGVGTGNLLIIFCNLVKSNLRLQIGCSVQVLFQTKQEVY